MINNTNRKHTLRDMSMSSCDYWVTGQSILDHAIKLFKMRANNLVSKLSEEEVNSQLEETPSTANNQNEPNKKMMKV